MHKGRGRVVAMGWKQSVTMVLRCFCLVWTAYWCSCPDSARRPIRRVDDTMHTCNRPSQMVPLIPTLPSDSTNQCFLLHFLLTFLPFSLSPPLSLSLSSLLLSPPLLCLSLFLSLPPPFPWLCVRKYIGSVCFFVCLCIYIYVCVYVCMCRSTSRTRLPRGPLLASQRPPREPLSRTWAPRVVLLAPTAA
jgi:hypothetical protein